MRLVRMLTQVNDFAEMSAFTEPVFIRQRGARETGDRNAQVLEVTEIEFPDVFGQAVRGSALATVSVSLIRELAWRHLPPGQLTLPVSVIGEHGGEGIELGPSNGPPNPTLVKVVNFRDDINLTAIYWRDASLAAWSANLIAAPSGTELLPAAPAVNDYHLMESTEGPFKHAVYGMKVGAVHTSRQRLEYWSGAAYTIMTLGVHYTLSRVEAGETVTDDLIWVSEPHDVLDHDGHFIFNFFPDQMTGWVPNADGPAATVGYHIRVFINLFNTWTVVPQKNGDDIYAQRTNYVEVPGTSIKGELWPLACIRMWAPSGGDETPSPATISRILIGAKADPPDELSTLDDFEAMINCGNADNPLAWSTIYDTDTSAVADIAYPGGSKGRTTFATDGTLRVRIKLTGAGVLPAYRGEYRLLVGFQQRGGVAGDISLSARIFNGEELDEDPHTDLGLYASLSADLGIEVSDLGLIQIPRTRSYSNDPVEDVNVAVHLLAERAGGSTAELDWAWVFFFPVTEGSVGVDDPVTDSNRGSSALRGGSYLALDNGCVANRTVKFQHHQADLVSPSEEWARFDTPIEFRNIGKRHRLYFLMLSYTSEGWGVEPLVANLGVGMAVQVFMHYRYLFLRGAN